jgi:hypothetical protein
MRVDESRKRRVPGRTMGGEGSEGHDAIRGPGAPAGNRPAKLRVSDARDGFGVRGCDRGVHSIALRLVAPDVRCAKKKVR